MMMMMLAYILSLSDGWLCYRQCF